MNDRLIRYGEDRALEHVAYVLGRTPTRIVRLLLPVHRVEVEATVTEGRPYALIDRFLEHGIAQGRLRSVAELADFLFLDPNLVDRAIRFLTAIGHVQEAGGVLSLTELGYRSVRDDKRYERVERDRRALYFDGFGSRPLSRQYYGSGRVTFLSLADHHDRFAPVLSFESFTPKALTDLARDPKRDHYNLPGRVDDLRMLHVEQVLLPAYIVRTLGPERDRYVAYTQIGEEDDAEITALYGSTPEVASLLELGENASEGGLDLAYARKWLAKRGLGEFEPKRRADGTWQLVLPATAFGRAGGENGLSVFKVGSFIVLGSDLIHVWCPDEKLRTDVLLKRMDAFVSQRSRVGASDVEALLSRLTRQLQLGPIDLPGLRHMAANAGLHGLAAQLSEF
ncbi:hypothetical protein NE235_02490 [Actinoallomurus spadix]|uniref:Uncharacterized protein n=1 Tax=Actinoallomurus spadix TaxID=79912 RepID=A0ABN0XJZ4_9ACTN|nr:hypothetical protein [Actinoallomurus spadix]MCO5984970.1 hypothetical protein [Actinoallomurus spadix]